MKLNAAPLCGVFKRHSPSRYSVWALFCREGFQPRPRFLCNMCKQYRGQEQIRALSRRRPFFRLGLRTRYQSIDEAHDIQGSEEIAKAIEQGCAKKPEKKEPSEPVYLKAVRRMRRVGVTDHVAQITYLENEIDYYRARVQELMKQLEEANK